MSQITKHDIFIDSAEFIHHRDEGNKLWLGVKKIAHEDEIADRLYYSYRREGFSIGTGQKAGKTEIDSIFFYFEANTSPGFERFKEIGPSGIRSGMTQGDVISILGEPEKTGGDFDHDVLGYQHPWIKYYPKPDVQLLVEIKDGKVWRGSVGTAFY